MKKILVLNGPNLNMLGQRNIEVYGKQSYEELQRFVSQCAEVLDMQVEFFQSNAEGELVDAIQGALHRVDGIILNAGAYTHSSIALLDALEAVKIAAIEVHLSNIYAREDFRRQSFPARACLAQIAGCGFYSYQYALHYLHEVLHAES